MSTRLKSTLLLALFLLITSLPSHAILPDPADIIEKSILIQEAYKRFDQLKDLYDQAAEYQTEVLDNLRKNMVRGRTVSTYQDRKAIRSLYQRFADVQSSAVAVHKGVKPTASDLAEIRSELHEEHNVLLDRVGGTRAEYQYATVLNDGIERTRLTARTIAELNVANSELTTHIKETGRELRNNLGTVNGMLDVLTRTMNLQAHTLDYLQKLDNHLTATNLLLSNVVELMEANAKIRSMELENDPATPRIRTRIVDTRTEEEKADAYWQRVKPEKKTSGSN